jgi:hypothetical protein
MLVYETCLMLEVATIDTSRRTDAQHHGQWSLVNLEIYKMEDSSALEGEI